MTYPITYTDQFRHLHFAVMAIEACAARAKTSGREMYERLKEQDLVHRRLFGMYEPLHTQSLDYVVDDVLTTLNNWEKEAAQ